LPQKESVDIALLFQKRSKSVSSASQKTILKTGEADPADFGLASKTGIALLFQKRSKSDSSASQKPHCSKLGEADPGGLGACPQERNQSTQIFFSRKEAKALVLFRRRRFTQTG
jgi:hypothetical protein